MIIEPSGSIAPVYAQAASAVWFNPRIKTPYLCLECEECVSASADGLRLHYKKEHAPYPFGPPIIKVTL